MGVLIVETSFIFSKGDMDIVPHRPANTLLPIIRKMLRSGTIMHSNEGAAYRQIQERLCFHHESVNHSIHFADLKQFYKPKMCNPNGLSKAEDKPMKGVRRNKL